MPPSVPSGYHLAFSDTFGGPQLDQSKWVTCYPWESQGGCTNAGNRESEWYLPGQVVVSGAALHLVADRRTVTGVDANLQPETFDYVSGMVSTAGHFKLTYGYIEFRAKLPSGRALWPALWLLPVSGTATPEVDIVELVGQDPTVAHVTLHWTSALGSRRQDGTIVKGTTWTTAWHDYALLWEPGRLTWYYDGRAVWSTTSQVPSQPMYIVATLAVGGVFPGLPDATTPFPSSLDISSVRVWTP